MTIRHLETLFHPRSVALVGASKRPGSIGSTVAHNLLTGDFDGDIWLVNPKYREINGAPCLKDIADLPTPPDLAVIATPPATVVDIVNTLGARGTRTMVILTAGLKAKDEDLRAAVTEHDIRIIGPNCLGILVPGRGLNASFSHRMALDGDLALISQSGAVVTTVVDWASSRGIGFSHIVSMGDMVDIDIDDMLDYAAADPGTRAILLYLEGIRDPQSFMSAARAAARVKPVIVIKAGRHESAAKAAISHTGALAGSDIAYDAAFERAGLLRVYDLDEMFAAAETISRLPLFSGDRLAILTNGGGTGILAADRLEDYGGTLGDLAPETLTRLDRVLPATWSRSNPIDIIGDAGPQRYREALEIALDDPETDAILILYCPTALASGRDVAQAILDTLDERLGKAARQKPVLTCWLGGDAAEEAREIFAKARLATFQTPGEAVRGYTHMVRYTTAQTALMRTPPDVSHRFQPDVETARRIVSTALERGKTLLDADDVKTVMKAYQIPVVEAAFARTPEDVAREVQAIIERPDQIDRCVIKIMSPDITHKSDIGGVRLNVLCGDEGRSAAAAMLDAVANRQPDATVDGFSVEPMIIRPDARELIIGLADDATFGPIMLFGAGGTAVEVVDDKALALPPLDLVLARQMISHTRVYRLLCGYRNIAPVDLDAVVLTLVKISQLAADFPEIRELDINPLLSDADGVISLDARIVVAPCPDRDSVPYNPRFAIRPYPGRLEEDCVLKNGAAVKIRPIRPADERFYETFFRYLSPHDIRMRLFGAVKSFTHEQVAHLTQIDYARAMAFVAIDTEEDALLGVSRLAADPDRESAEFAVIVRSDLKGVGLGWALMQKLIVHARSENLKELHGQVLAENRTMLKMCHDLGFESAVNEEDPSIFHVRLALHPAK